MRIEPAKNQQTEKPKEKSNFKTEQSVFDTSVRLKTADAPKTPPASGAFAKILEEARQDGARSRDRAPAGKTDAVEGGGDAAETDEKDAARRGEQKTEEKNRRDGEGGGEADDENDQNAYASGALAAERKSTAEAGAPAARAILHVADLERIVAFVRTQSQAGAAQVVIALKHSVLEGLQIRLARQENGLLKAEFLAASEEIKKQLKRRERELLDILKQRSPRFSTIEILLA